MPRNDRSSFSRRIFLQQMGCAPVLFLPAPMITPLFRWAHPNAASAQTSPFPFADVRLTPHYPARSPLDDILALASPGTDEYVTEGHVAEILTLLEEWSRQLKVNSDATKTLIGFVDASIRANDFTSAREIPLRAGSSIKVFQRKFSADILGGRDRFVANLRSYLSSLGKIEVADFDIFSCTQSAESPLTVELKIRYDFVGLRDENVREERIGTCLTRWSRNSSRSWHITQWKMTEEKISRAAGSIFIDITSHALGSTRSYKQQLLHGADYWRTVLDGAIGVDVYGNNGVAVGDFDNDGLDDLYVCQPAGLPNRLYRNRGDGTFEDVTEQSGVGALDFTACALFADFDNRGIQDLLVVCSTGPLLFVNDGHGNFSLKQDAFRFERPPQGAFTHAAIADYDRDGRLDIYFCLYNYYQGLDQYRYPVPYFDARNGPPNYLFHNEGGGVFQDHTEASGLNVENDRYSFACSWGDSNGDGWPDLYVVNDFGRNNLYRNKGDGTFAAISEEAKVNEAGAGMSGCWLDFDNDGKQDIYAAGMWVAAGMRIFEDSHFHAGEPETVRGLYRRHMAGNSLYRNLGDGTFQDVGETAGVEMGRWSWSTDAWDFDHDGYSDLYVANGYISGPAQRDVSSFFWRQVVAKSPQDANASPAYERGWSAMNELIRSDSTWNGHERNVFLANNRDGTFSDVSGVVGMDFRDDSRAFSLADLDGDGRLEIVLKNRNAPQLRILRLAMKDIGNSIVLRLRGTKSNRDAIGAAVTIEAGNLRQTKYLQAGSGFLSQHTKELFFGVGGHQESVRANIRWPSGPTQTYAALPINRRIEIVEGSEDFRAKPFAISPRTWATAGTPASSDIFPESYGTWLIEAIQAPEFSLPDTAGNLIELRSFRNSLVLLNFWASDSRLCRQQLQTLRQAQISLHSRHLRILAINVDDPMNPESLKSFAAKETTTFPILLGSQYVAGVYNIIYRYIFDRHRDIPLPTSFLIDRDGNIAKVYQGLLTKDQLSRDWAAIPTTLQERLQRALPFAGNPPQSPFQRNQFTYGVAFFQHGFLDEAARSFQQVIAKNPDDPDAHYNLGTLYLRRNSFVQAQRSLEDAVRLRPDYPEAWNNLGMLAAQQGKDDEAIRDFQRSLQLRPSYATAALNLGNIYRRQENLNAAQTLLKRAYDLEPTNPEASYGLGMLYAHQGETDAAVDSLQRAISLRPDYAEALNNLGVLFVQNRRYSEAEQEFKICIERAPDFDQAYLNLARLYMVSNEKEKARVVLQSLLQKQPQHKMAQQMLQMLY